MRHFCAIQKLVITVIFHLLITTLIIVTPCYIVTLDSSSLKFHLSMIAMLLWPLFFVINHSSVHLLYCYLTHTCMQAHTSAHRGTCAHTQYCIFCITQSTKTGHVKTDIRLKWMVPYHTQWHRILLLIWKQCKYNYLLLKNKSTAQITAPLQWFHFGSSWANWNSFDRFYWYKAFAKN